MQRQGTVKKLAAAVIALSAMAVMGGPSNALALGFDFGHSGFFVYGGNEERYENFGNNSAVPTLDGLLTPGALPTTRNISGDLARLEVGVPTGVGLRYSIMGSSTDGQNFYVSTTAGNITPTMINNSDHLVGAGNFLFWGGQHANATGGLSNYLANNPSFTAKSAAHSFTTMLGNDGSIVGSFNFNTHAALGQSLNIFRVNIDGTDPIYTKVGSAIMTANGQLTITPVPVPAAVVLFGSGLVGLVGLARRKKMQGLAA